MAIKIRFGSWPSYGKNSGIYVGKCQGGFAKEGIDLAFCNSFQNTLDLLQNEEVDICQILFTSAVKEMATGGDCIIIGIRDKFCPCGTLSLKGSQIKTPNDYQHRRWGHTASFSEDRFLLHMLGKSLGFEASSIDLIDIPYRNRLTALLGGEVDFISAWWGTGYPDQFLDPRSDGYEFDYIPWHKFGLLTFGDCLIARRKWTSDNAEIVSAFLNAAAEGFLEAEKDPKAAFKAISAQEEISTTSRDFEKMMLSIIQSLELLALRHRNQNEVFRVSYDKYIKALFDVPGDALNDLSIFDDGFIIT